MTGKQAGVALGAGVVAGVVLYLYRLTLGPVVASTLNSVGGAK